MPQVHAASYLVLGEVAWAGSSASLADEWIELWNLGSASVSLQGYSLSGASGNRIFFPDDAVIPAGGTFLVSNYSQDDTKSALAAPIQMVTTTVSLSNSALRLALLEGENEIDVVGDGTAPFAGSSGTIKASMIRVGDTWITATSSAGFGPDRTDLGTPGVCDGCVEEEIVVVEVPVEEPVIEEPAPEIMPEEIPEPVIETTSTEMLEETPIIITEEVTSTIEVLPLQEATSTSEVPTSTEPVLAPQEPAVNAVTQGSLPPRYENLRLNEVMPQPDNESEWIEITSLDPGTPVPLQGVTLYDGSSKIATIATGTVDLVTPFVRISLSSSRLNNDGDTVTLKDPNGSTHDGFLYTYSEKGASWIRTPDKTGDWRFTTTPTPGATNLLTDVEEEIEEEEIIETPTVTPAPILTTPPPPSKPVTPVVETPKPKTTIPVKVAAPKKETKTVKATPAPKKAATVKAPAKPKAAPVTKKITKSPIQPLLITHAMSHEESNAGIPVVLQGTVGTPPGLLTGHYFVLLAPDGKGLKVHVPTSRKLPDVGQNVRVAGVLAFNDAGIPTLGMRKDDTLEILTGGSNRVDPRIVDLMTPATEDAWSLIQVTGTVLGIKGKTVTLNLGDTEIDVAIKAILNYRVARIAVGDTVRIRGVLETAADMPHLIPRSADDIVIVGHADIAPKQSASTSNLPGWTPFGAAAIAVAGTEGAKQLRERRKHRKLEKILETGLTGSEERV
ncbi:MAG: lamin tail domain-containing protein [Patescibacteria group bacterium]